MSLTAERAKELLIYNQDTGEFFWRAAIKKVTPGSKAGCRDGHGYCRIQVDGRRYHGHRLAWLMTYGKWPEQTIDHINGNRMDNRLCNLRDVDTRTNNRNRTVLNSNNQSGYPGVRLDPRNQRKQRWHARLNQKEGGIWVGTFDTAEEAHAALEKVRARIYSQGDRA